MTYLGFLASFQSLHGMLSLSIILICFFKNKLPKYTTKRIRTARTESHPRSHNATKERKRKRKYLNKFVVVLH